jgi:glycosyltransferase involved in cell wall biosynthesis
MQTLHSVQNQEGVSVTTVVVDDASDDDTYARLHALDDIEVIRHAVPTEQRIARNHGAERASTDWIAFCDDDDLWAPSKLSQQLRAAEAAGADWCTSSAIHVDGMLTPIGGERLRDPKEIVKHIPYRNVVPGGGSGVLVRRSLFEDVKGFRNDARFAEDWDLWLRLSRTGVAACVDELLVAYRQWAQSFSHHDFQAQFDAFSKLTLGADEASEARAKPQGSSAFEVRQRLRSEGKVSVAKDLPRLMLGSPRDLPPMLLMLALPETTLTWMRLRRLGRREVERACTWLKPYRLTMTDHCETWR